MRLQRRLPSDGRTRRRFSIETTKPLQSCWRLAKVFRLLPYELIASRRSSTIAFANFFYSSAFFLPSPSIVPAGTETFVFIQNARFCKCNRCKLPVPLRAHSAIRWSFLRISRPTKALLDKQDTIKVRQENASTQWTGEKGAHGCHLKPDTCMMLVHAMCM